MIGFINYVQLLLYTPVLQTNIYVLIFKQGFFFKCNKYVPGGGRACSDRNYIPYRLLMHQAAVVAVVLTSCPGKIKWIWSF